MLYAGAAGKGRELSADNRRTLLRLLTLYPQRALPAQGTLFVDTDQSNEDEFPVLVMDWVEGQTLDAYLRDNIDNPSRLKKLSSDFNRMALWLLTQPFAHGDLKPDNIIVKSDGSLVLVDYDGMYVPAMKDRQSRETGSPNFRHPQRSEKWFDEYIDDFPLSLMATSLYALGLKPELLKEYNAKDAILFTEKDLLNLPQSKLYSALSAFLYDKTFAKLHSLMQLSLARVPIKGMYAPVIADLDAKQDVYKFLFEKAMKLYKTSDDKTEAYRLFTQAATPYYLTQPMQIYCKTSEEVEAEKRGIKTYTSSAEHNDVTAQFILGECYFYGWGVDQDYKQAVEWYKKAAEQGNAIAQCNLGYCYDVGRGVEQDYKQAVEWYEQAAKQGNEAAKNRLKELLNPEITDKEYKEAITDEYGAKYTKDGLKLIHVPTHLTSYTIKEGTKVIGYYYIGAFNGCTSLQSLVIPDSVTEIGGWNAFNGCTSLQSLVIPDSVTKIGGNTFSGCTSLQSVVIPDGCNKIGWNTFRGCTSLQSLVIPDGVTYIGDYAFCGCTSLQSVVIPDSVTEIGESVFSGCESLQSLVIPDSVTEIGKSAFEDCSSLQSVVLLDSVTEIGKSAFNGCKSLQSVVIPDSVTEIGGLAFSGCTSLQSIIIPDGVTEIGNSAFSSCTSLQSVVIPDSITEIGSSAFNGCHQLTLNSKSPFFKVENNILYSKDGRVISCWSEDKNIELPYGITGIGWNAFNGCTSLQSVVLPDGVTYIGRDAFSGCTSLQSVVIPDSVIEIGESAFGGCTSLQSVVIPDSVTEIGRDAFSGCTSLQSLVLPDGVTYIGDYAFSGCTSLQSIVLPDSVTKIGRNTFADCSSLHPVVLPDGVTYIEIEDDSPF